MSPLLIRTQSETYLTIPEIRLFSTDFKKGEIRKKPAVKGKGKRRLKFSADSYLTNNRKFLPP